MNKSLLKNLNKTYIANPIKNTNQIDELMSKFIGGELETIKSVLESNFILNFKDSNGETLIHAILKNESPNITEDNKLQIIKILNDKNVSLNSMNQLNQNPLHIACQKGYVSVIIFLLEKGCNQNLNDNDGNAPIHYLIDKFIETCKQDDLYKPSNQEIKSVNSKQIKKINDIIKNQNLNTLIKLFENVDNLGNPHKSGDIYNLFPNGNQIINALNTFIKHSTQNLLPIIYNLIENKITDINKIFIDKTDSDENKFLKAKNLFLNTKEQIAKLYKFNLDNNTIIWDDFINIQKLKIIKNKNEYVEKINLNKKNIMESLNNIKKKLVEFKKKYLSPFIQYTNKIFYIYMYFKNNYNLDRLIISSSVSQNLHPNMYVYKIANKEFDLIDNKTNKLIQEFHVANIIYDSQQKFSLVAGKYDNYGICKLHLEDDDGNLYYDDYTNTYFANGKSYHIDDLCNEGLKNILTDVSGNVVNVGGTIVSHSELDKRAYYDGDSIDSLIYLNKPIYTTISEFEEDINESSLYVSGFYKIKHPVNNEMIWVYGTYIPGDIHPPQIDINNYVFNFVPLNEFADLQTKKNLFVIENLLTQNEKDKNLKKFIKNTFNANTYSDTDTNINVKKIIADSYLNAYESMFEIIEEQNNLSVELLNEFILPNEYIIKAILNSNLTFLADVGFRLQQFITIELAKIVPDKFRLNMYKCLEYNYDGFGFKCQDIIFYLASQNKIIQTIINDDDLMNRFDKYNDVHNHNIPITKDFLKNIKNISDNKDFMKTIDLTMQKFRIFINFMSGFDMNINDLKLVINDIILWHNKYAHLLPNFDYVFQQFNLFPTNNPNFNLNLNNDGIMLYNIMVNISLNIINSMIPNKLVDLNHTRRNSNPKILNLGGSLIFTPGVSVQTTANDIANLKNISTDIILEFLKFLICEKIYDNIYKAKTSDNTLKSYDFINYNNGMFTNFVDIPDNLKIFLNNLCTNILNIRIEKTYIIKTYVSTVNKSITNYISRNILTHASALDKLDKLTELEIKLMQNKNITEINELATKILQNANNQLILLGNADEHADFKKILANTILNTLIGINVDDPNNWISNNLHPKTFYNNMLSNSIVLGTEYDVISAVISLNNSFNIVKTNLLMKYLPNSNDIENIKFEKNPGVVTKKINDKYFWTIDKYFVLTPINNLLKIIYLDIDLIISSFDIFNDENKLRHESTLINLFFIKYYANILTRNLNNLVLLEKYIYDINFESFFKSSDTVNNILNDLINDKNLNIDSKNILAKLLKYKSNLDNIKNTVDDVNKAEHKKKISDVYNDVLKIFSFFDEIVDNINKYQSEYQLEKYNDYVNQYIDYLENKLNVGFVGTSTHAPTPPTPTPSTPTPSTSTPIPPIPNIDLTNSFFNNYTFGLRKKFPDSYEKYKEFYFNINPELGNIYNIDINSNPFFGKYVVDPKNILINKNFKNDIIKNVYPYVNSYNYNEFYINYKKEWGYMCNCLYDFDKTTNLNYPFDKVNSKFLTIIKESVLLQNEFANINFMKSNFNSNILKLMLAPTSLPPPTPPLLPIVQLPNKFALGYNMLHDKNINLSSNKNKFNDALVDINYIMTKSLFKTNSDGTVSISNDSDNVVKYFFETKKNISKIDFSTYLITNNLNELINSIVYIIYKGLNSNTNLTNLSNLFFENEKKIDLDLYNDDINSGIKIGNKKSIELGINLNDFSITDKYKKNLSNTLAFLKNEVNEKKNYLLDNIKTFVKIIVNTQINKEIEKILEQINLNQYSTLNNKIIIEKSAQIDLFNNKLSNIKLKYNQLDNIVNDIIKNSTNPTLEYNQLARIMGNNVVNKNSKKILENKCLNVKKTEDLLSIDFFDYKVLDINGNTIINRLIDQYNLYGIEKIIKLKPFLSTYKNNNNQTPIEYLSNAISNIQNEYHEKQFEQRIKKYSIILTNLVESNESFKNISINNSENLVKEIITNSIYLFNEIMWLKLYEYPSGWENIDKKKLKNILKINGEKLLISTFDINIDIKMFVENTKQNLGEKLNLYTNQLEENINNYKNKINQYKYDKYNKLADPNDLTNLIDASGNLIKKYEDLENENNNIKNAYLTFIKDLNDKVEKETKPHVEKILNEYKDKKLIKFINIDWDNYEQMVFKLDSNYLNIIKILNDGIKTKYKNENIISNFLLCIIKNDINNTNVDLSISKYFNVIFDSIFADYWDLDKYEDSEYNVLNKSILEILNINVVGIVSNELFNSFVNFIIQKNIYTDEIKNKIDSIKNTTTKITNTIINSIKTFLYDCVIVKLDKKNPEKFTYVDLETQKKNIINELNHLIGNNLDSDDMNELNKIINFNQFLCENISYNCFEEITKILYDCKKMSIYYKIHNVLNQQ